MMIPSPRCHGVHPHGTMSLLWLTLSSPPSTKLEVAALIEGLANRSAEVGPKALLLIPMAMGCGPPHPC